MAGIERRLDMGKSPKEKWFSPDLPLSGSARLVVGTFDLATDRLVSLSEKFKSMGFDIWKVPEGAYSTIYFWSPVDEDLSTRLRARWYRRPIELETVNYSGRIKVDPNQLAILETKATFPNGQGEEFEIKYRQQSDLKSIFEILKDLPGASSALNSSKKSFGVDFSSYKIPHELFTAIAKIHPSGLVPTVMVSAVRDHFVVDSNYPDSLRVTIDHNYKYHSFWGTAPLEASYIGTYPNLRIEIKVADDELLEEAGEVITVLKQEAAFVPKITKHADKTFIDHKYSKTRFPIVPTGNLE